MLLLSHMSSAGCVFLCRYSSSRFAVGLCVKSASVAINWQGELCGERGEEAVGWQFF